ncbi:uncharacterized protein LOC144927061 [Branchiostoma floridae x Branchiostoma belcheri]
MPLAATMLLFGVIGLLTLIPAHACPSVCQCFAYVPSVHCNRPTLEHIPQGIPNTTTTLQMKGTRLVSVRQGDLSGLPLLRTLYLYDNQVQTIQVGAFDNNPNIQSLGVSNNDISEVSPGVFRGLNSLRELDMRANKITSIPAGVFNGLPSLRVVRLLGNRIKTMSVGAFSNLSATILYSLESNRIVRIANGVFGSPQGATTMMLNNNNISVIEPGALSSFVSMTRLWINSNRISTLQGVFAGLREMTQIYAQYNSISALNKGDFSGLTKLRELNLYNNKISTIAGRAFANLSSLERLTLHNNKISTIAGRAFANLSSLERLTLQDNEISDIGDDTFYGLFNLRYLYMSGNKLETVAGGVFANLPNLYFLTLSNNRLLRMEARLPLALRSLFLQSNALTEVPNTNMEEVRELDLSFNPIDVIRNEDFVALRNVGTFRLSGIKYFRERGKVDPDVFNGLDNIVALGLANNSLTRVPTSALRSLWRLTSLDLSGNEFTTVEYGDFDNLTNIQDLDLSANKLTTVSREALANMSSLRSLVLSDNPIVYVGPDAFGPQLTEVKLQNTKLRIIDGAAFNSSPNVNQLTLSNNHLQYLPETVFQPLTYYGDHETLDLARNPWVCDCQLAGYHAWLKTPKASAIPSLYCTSPPSLAGQSLRRLGNNSLNCSCEAVESPRIDTAGSTTWAAAGDEAILRCKVNACPDAAVLWTAARGISLTSQSEFPDMYVQADGTLVIPAVTPGDAGRYTCMAVNAFGTAEAEIRLEVTVGPTGQAVGIHTFNHPVWIFAAVHVLVFYWYISGVDI